MTLQNEGQYGPRVRDGAATAIRRLNPAVVVALPTRARPAARPEAGATSGRRSVASRRDASAALLAALADLGAEHQIGTRSLQRFASTAARAVGADVLTIRLIDGQARWLVLAASVGMPKTLRLELRRLMVDAALGRTLVRRGRRVVWAHPAPARVPTIWLLGMAGLRGAGALIPIRAGKRMLGVLGVGYRQPTIPAAPTLRMLDAFARQLGGMLAADRAHAAHRRASEETRTLRRITTTLSAGVGEHSALDMITTAAAQLTRASGAIVMLPSRDHSEFEVASQSDSRGSLHLVGLRFPAQGSMAAQVVRSGRPYSCRDALTERRPMLRALVTLGGVRGLVIVPLRGTDGVIGTLNVFSATPRAFSERDRRILVLLGEHASIAIQNARLFDAVRDHRQLLRQLYSEQFSVLEGERKRIAHELHDEMGPTLSATLINLQLFKNFDGDDEALVAKVDETEGLLTGIIEKVRELAYGLRPPMLEHLGLAESLKWMIATYFSAGSLIVDYRHRAIERAVDPDLALAIYRIAQEALTNVVKHAEATRVLVRLAVSGARLQLRIEDDGCGFEVSQRPTERRAGLGLASMRERVEHLHGEMHLRSSPGRGCRLLVSCPIEVKRARTAR